MSRLLRAELAKFFTVRIGLGLIVVAMSYTLITVAAQVVFADFPGLPGLRTPESVRGVFAAANAGLSLTLVLGILVMTSEYRHQTLTPTFLATPHRGRVVLSKTLAAVVIGLLIGVACVATGLITALTALQFKSHAVIPADAVVRTLTGVTVAYVCYAVLGTAIGTLITNQVAAITSSLLWVVLAEPLVVNFFPKYGKWLPGGAASGLAQGSSIKAVNYLSQLPAALVLVGYTVALAAVASRTTLRRDVT